MGRKHEPPANDDRAVGLIVAFGVANAAIDLMLFLAWMFEVALIVRYYSP